MTMFGLNRLWQIMAAFVILMFLTLPVQSENTPLQRLDSWGLNRGWEGVGLLNIAGQATCTGVLIQSDLVLTAAHCLYDLETGRMTDPTKIEFRAGWRGGKAVARRMGKTALVHRAFATATRLNGNQIRSDVGLLQLASPIPPTHADPFQIDRGAQAGHLVSVVSYGAGRNDAPSRQRECGILQREQGLLAMSCDVVPGSSGSPVFAMRNGRPRIVSLVSSMGNVNGAPVSFGMDIKEPLGQVLSDFRAGRGVFPQARVSARNIRVGSDRNVGGARFLTP